MLFSLSMMMPGNVRFRILTAVPVATVGRHNR